MKNWSRLTSGAIKLCNVHSRFRDHVSCNVKYRDYKIYRSQSNLLVNFSQNFWKPICQRKIYCVVWYLAIRIYCRIPHCSWSFSKHTCLEPNSSIVQGAQTIRLRSSIHKVSVFSKVIHQKSFNFTWKYCLFMKILK